MNDREKAYEIALMQAEKVRFPGVAMDRSPKKKKKKAVTSPWVDYAAH